MIELKKIGKESTIAERELFLRKLKLNSENEGILLQTCNRVEFYSGQGFVSTDIIEHLFRVVAGLDSVIIGETAIVNQVKLAYQEAVVKTNLDKNLHKLFQTALFVGKRVRKETGISTGAMSHSQAAVDLVLKEAGNFANLNITIIGVNELNEKIIRLIVDKGAKTVFVGNRTYEKAKLLAEKFNTQAVRFDSLPEVLEETDVLISATAAPHLILKKENFHSRRKILILDLAVPRDIDPAIQEFPNVTLFDIERIEKQIVQNVHLRKQKISQAEEIIRIETDAFLRKTAFNKSKN